MANKETVASFKGKCIGVRIHPRGEGDPHAMVTLMVEDDGNWFDKMTISSYWVDEMLEMLSRARAELGHMEPDRADPSLGYAPGRVFGWRIPSKGKK